MKNLIILTNIILTIQFLIPINAQTVPKPELIVQTGHTSIAGPIGFTSDGKLLVSTSPYQTVKLWDVVTGRELKTLLSSGENVELDIANKAFDTTVKLSPDGKILASGGKKKYIELRDVFTGQELILPECILCFGYSPFAFSPDNKMIIARNPFGGWTLSDLQTGKEINLFKNISSEDKSGLNDELSGFSPDGKILIFKSKDKTVKLWVVASGKELNLLKSQIDSISEVTFSPNGKTIVAISKDKTIKLLKVLSGQELKILERTDDEISSIRFSPDGKMLAGSGKKSIKIWSITTGKVINTLQVSDYPVFDFSFSPNSKIITTMSVQTEEDIFSFNEYTLKIWDITTGKELNSLKGCALANISPSSKIIAMGCADGNIKLWDVASKQELKTLKKHSEHSLLVAASPDGKKLASTTSGGVPINGRLLILKDFIEVIKVMSGGNKSTLFALGNENKNIKLWDTSDRQEPLKLQGHTGIIRAIVFSPDGQMLASASDDKTIILWDTITGQILNILKEHKDYVNSVAFSSDGKMLASGSNDGTVKLWDVTTGSELKTLKTLDRLSLPISVSFSPDGAILATGCITKNSSDNIILWDVVTGKETKTLGWSKAFVTSVTFSSDGKTLAAQNIMDGIIKLWNISSSKEIKSFTKDDPNTVREVFALVPDFYRNNYDELFTQNGKFKITKGANARLNFVEVKTAKLLASLIFLDEKDWAIIAPDGRFDTNKLENPVGLHWLLPDAPLTPLSFEVFTRQYFEPKLLPRLLKCTEENDCDKEFKPLPSIADINRVQPKVVIKEIKAATNIDLADVTVEIENVSDKVSISATDRTKKKQLSSGVFDVRLFRDGQMIGNSTPTEKLASFYQAAPDLIEQNKKYFAETKQLTNTPEDEAWRTANNLATVKDVKFDGKSKYTYTFKNIKLPHDGRKEVEFTAYAFNADRVKSDNVVKTFPIPVTVANKPKPKRAFVVAFGVNKYQSPSWDLQFAANDARAMRGILADKLRKTGDYAEVVEIPLISDDETIGGKTLQRREATKQNVQTVLELLAEKTPDEKRLKTLTAALGAETIGKIKPANPEDAVFISFSSHGYADRNGIFYILPTDIGTGLPRTVSPELLRNSISSDELSLWLRDVDAGEMVMIVDACNAEAAVKNSEFKPAPMGSRGLGQLAYDKGMKILTATQAANVAIETGAIGHGLLTYALIGEGLGKENRADFRAADKTINLKEWLEYGEFRVPGLYDDLLNKRLKIVGKGTDVIDLSGDNPKQNSASQTPVLFDFTIRRQEMTLVRLP